MTKTDDLQHGTINERACYLILQHGTNDAGHHKQWLLDQVLRLLAGSAYSQLIDELEADGYKWDEGIAP